MLFPPWPPLPCSALSLVIPGLQRILPSTPCPARSSPQQPAGPFGKVIPSLMGSQAPLATCGALETHPRVLPQAPCPASSSLLCTPSSLGTPSSIMSKDSMPFRNPPLHPTIPSPCLVPQQASLAAALTVCISAHLLLQNKARHTVSYFWSLLVPYTSSRREPPSVPSLEGKEWRKRGPEGRPPQPLTAPGCARHREQRPQGPRDEAFPQQLLPVI